MTWKRRAAALLLGVLMLFTSAPVVMPVFAGGGESESAGTAEICDLKTAGTDFDDSETTTTENEVWETKGAQISFSFVLTPNSGELFQNEDAIIVETNLGDFFEPLEDWGSYPEQKIYDTDGATLLATVKVMDAGKQVIFTIQQDSQTEITGSVSLPGLTAKDVGAEQDEPKKVELKVGTATQEITFHWVQQSPPSSGGGTPGLVDMATFWKNAGSTGNYTGSWFTMEVNPYGSLDLYSSTTFPEEKGTRTPKSYQNLFVIDDIPNHGEIDKDSIMICASIPHLVKWEGEDFNAWNGFEVPKGTYFAQRLYTGRPTIKDQMTEVVQHENESKTDFEKRVKENQLQWGIYVAEDGSQTFMCNFGNIGKFDESTGIQNNGIDYDQFDEKGKAYAQEYPEIFGEDGASGGNIVSYYIEFNAYYPSLTEITSMTNQATLYAMNDSGGYDQVGGNISGQYTIINAAGIGMAKKNALEILLVDRDEKVTAPGTTITYQKPIKGGTFAVQKQEGGGWETVESLENLITNASGRITVTNFEPGTYRVVQTGWVDGYVEKENAYKDPWNGAANKGTSVSLKEETLGEFTIGDEQKYGFGALVENWKPDDPGPVEPPVTKEETTEVTVTKVWSGGSAEDRPESVTVELLRNEVVYGTVQLSDNNGWTHTFADLPVKDEDGALYEYTAKEVSVPGYTTQITGDAEEGFIITNTKEADPDPSPDPGPGPDPSPDPGPGPDPDPDPSPDPGPGPDPDPDPSPDPGPGTKPDPDPDPDEPDEPAGPDTPDTPDEPGTPDVPEEPGTDIPDDTPPETGAPGEPEEPGTDIPDTTPPETGAPGEPEEPGTDIPDSTPPETDVPGEPDEPGETGEPSLPQTGQLWLPVGLLALAGAALTAAGVAGRTRRHGKRERRP